MQRRDEIRAAMQSLLSPGKRPEPAPSAEYVPAPSTDSVPVPAERNPLRAIALPVQSAVLKQLQGDLEVQGIAAQPAEILGAIVEALLERPRLCRGLLAAHLLGPSTTGA